MIFQVNLPDYTPLAREIKHSSASSGFKKVGMGAAKGFISI
jgi:hypothetical protein